MGPTFTLNGPWVKPPYKNPRIVGRCKISPSGLTLNDLTLNFSAHNDQTLPDKGGPLPRLQGTMLHFPLTWTLGIKTFLQTSWNCTYILYHYKYILQNKIPMVEIGCRQSWFPSERVYLWSLPLSDKGADPVTMITHSDEFSDSPNIHRFWPPLRISLIGTSKTVQSDT